MEQLSKSEKQIMNSFWNSTSPERLMPEPLDLRFHELNIGQKLYGKRI